MIIVANVRLDKKIVTNEAFTALRLMAPASTRRTVPVVTPLLAPRREGEPPAI
jgi:hypothetical protein